MSVRPVVARLARRLRSKTLQALAWVLLLLVGCSDSAAQLATTEPPLATAASSASAGPTASLAGPESSATIQPSSAAPAPASPSPTATSLHTMATSPSSVSPPGWSWHEVDGAPGVQFLLPQTWRAIASRPQRYQSAETGSLLEAQAHAFSGSGWLRWIQHESQPAGLLADGFVKQNGIVEGRPAFLFLEADSGSWTLELYIRDEARIISFFFQSGTLPRLEREMQTIQTMFDSIQFGEDGGEDTHFPTGWVDGYTLTIYDPERFDFSGEFQTITATIEAWNPDPTMKEATVVAADGTTYQIDLRDHFIFRGFPVPYSRSGGASEVQSGQTIRLLGYPRGQTPNGTERFYPLLVETVDAGVPLLHGQQTFFDLDRFDPAILGRYPLSTTVYLHGSWGQVSQLVADEPGNPLIDRALALDPDTQVLVIGKLGGNASNRLLVDRLYYRDGNCELVRLGVQQCQYYRPIELAK